MEIHNLQNEYDIKNIAVIGNRLEKVQWEFTNPDTGKIAPAGKIHMFSCMTETNLLFDSEHTVPFLQKTMGLKLNGVTKAKRAELTKLSEVQTMGCWPSGDSMKVIDGIVIIKLSDD